MLLVTVPTLFLGTKSVPLRIEGSFLSFLQKHKQKTANWQKKPASFTFRVVFRVVPRIRYKYTDGHYRSFDHSVYKLVMKFLVKL